MRYSLLIGFITLVLTLVLSGGVRADLAEFEARVAKQLNETGLSDRIDVFIVDKDKRYEVQGQERSIGAGFQPSVLLDDKGGLHIFFQARLDGSGDRSQKMIAHVLSKDGGKTFSKPQFINVAPLQVYAMSAFGRKSPDGGQRLSVLTSLSVDETLGRLKDPESVKKSLGIDVSNMSRKAGCIILEFYSDDLGKTWKRKEHRGISDRTYKRNGKDYYLAFINLIGQVRRIADGPYKGRLILGGPLRGSYLPCKDHPHFRNYHSSSSLIFSDDDGESWQFGGVISDETAFAHNEASAVAVNGGKQILLVRRNNARGAKGKMMHLSNDGGASWEKGYLSTITATRCLQVLETHGKLVLCSAPGKTNRTMGTIYVSGDGGKSWTPRIIEKGKFSYSTVNRLTGKYLISCYSRGHHGEQGISARLFSLDWLPKSK